MVSDCSLSTWRSKGSRTALEAALLIPSTPPLAAPSRIATLLQLTAEGQGPRKNIFSCLKVISNVSTAKKFEVKCF
jgi:hypothetical protein